MVLSRQLLAARHLIVSSASFSGPCLFVRHAMSPKLQSPSSGYGSMDSRCLSASAGNNQTVLPRPNLPSAFPELGALQGVAAGATGRSPGPQRPPWPGPAGELHQHDACSRQKRAFGAGKVGGARAVGSARSQAARVSRSPHPPRVTAWWTWRRPWFNSPAWCSCSGIYGITSRMLSSTWQVAPHY